MTKMHSNLVLVRHGQSLWNEKGLWTGWKDIGLNENGKQEALKAAESISDIDFDIAFSSDLLRAFQTLELIKKKLKLHHIPTVIESGLNERHYGIYTGKNKWQIKKSIGEDKFNRLRRSWDEPIPEGESLKDVHKRAVPVYIKNILPLLQKGQNVLVVAHGNSNRALIKHIEGISDEQISEVELVTGEVVVYHMDKKGEVLKKEKRESKAKTK